MADWDKLKSFHVAAETGSLTAAAGKLGISQSAVSRQIASLEKDLQVSLFQRHARGLVMTDEGATLFRSTQHMARAAGVGLSDLQHQQDVAEGVLRIAAPAALGVAWLIPGLARFRKTYPDLRLDIRLDDHFYDLLQLEADCAIRIRPAQQGDLIQRQLTELETGLFASEKYLTKHGRPEKPQDLDDHSIIGFGPAKGVVDRFNWATRVGRSANNPRTACIEINNIFGMLRAARSGMGIVALPTYVAALSNQIERVLPDQSGPSFAVYFVYPTTLKHAKRLIVFRDFLEHELSKTMMPHENNEWVSEL